MVRITKTRLMRKKTINPNPPICRSKEPSLTVINIYSCSTNELINHIEHYNWNLTQAQAAADGGSGTYTLGYFYEAAFKKYTSLDQKNCPKSAWVEFYPGEHPEYENIVSCWISQKGKNKAGFRESTFIAPAGGSYPEGWAIEVIEVIEVTPETWTTRFNLTTDIGFYPNRGITIDLTTPYFKETHTTPVYEEYDLAPFP